MQPVMDAAERRRVDALRRYEILDTAPESDFDRLTRIGASVIGAPVCLISLVDEHRVWCKSEFGMGTESTPRELSFCTHAIQRPEAPFVVRDAQTDERFRANPFVTGPPYVRFYAGAPLVSTEGEAVGTFCIVDHAPRLDSLPSDKLAIMQDLAALTITLMEARMERQILRQAERRLHQAQSVMRELLSEREQRIRDLEAGA